MEKLFFRYEIEQKVKQLADIYKAIIPGNKGPISVNLSGHQIIIEHLLAMRVCFGCGVIYLESHYIYVEGKMRIIALLKFIIQNMYSLRTAMNAIMSSSGLDEKKVKGDDGEDCIDSYLYKLTETYMKNEPVKVQDTELNDDSTNNDNVLRTARNLFIYHIVADIKKRFNYADVE